MSFLIYLDNCCFNRPFDDQEQVRIRLETEAKLYLQEMVRRGSLQLVWSFMLNLENDANPFEEKRLQISPWKDRAVTYVPPLDEVRECTIRLASRYGLRPADAAHLACALHARADFFFTTDRRFIKAAKACSEIRILNPLDWFMEVTP